MLGELAYLLSSYSTLQSQNGGPYWEARDKTR
jgi:hypothetical protein